MTANLGKFQTLPAGTSPGAEQRLCGHYNFAGKGIGEAKLSIPCGGATGPRRVTTVLPHCLQSVTEQLTCVEKEDSTVARHGSAVCSPRASPRGTTSRKFEAPEGLRLRCCRSLRRFLLNPPRCPKDAAHLRDATIRLSTPDARSSLWASGRAKASVACQCKLCFRGDAEMLPRPLAQGPGLNALSNEDFVEVGSRGLAWVGFEDPDISITARSSALLCLCRRAFYCVRPVAACRRM